jgi:acetaldehyde dehydrogenase / alcohol dehydrogenase
LKTVADRAEHLLWLRLPKEIYFQRGITSEALHKVKPTMKRIFLVTDAVMEELHLTDKLLAIFNDIGATVHVFDRVQPDPTWDTIQEGVREMNAFKPDAVIAFGGGSPIDAAKMMRISYEHPELSVQDMASRFLDITKRSLIFPNAGTKVNRKLLLLKFLY